MKLNGYVLVAMMVGSLGAVGCKNDNATEAVAPEETEDAPLIDKAANGSGNANDLSVRFETDAVRTHYYAPRAAPAVRYEVQGRAPSERHFWAPGYYRWNGREHVWYNGRWMARRDNYDYVGPRWVGRGARYEYVPGHYVRRY